MEYSEVGPHIQCQFVFDKGAEAIKFNVHA